MTNRVLIKRSGTANSVPLAGDLQAGELAINYTDGNLFYKNSSNVVTVIASNQFVSVAGNITGGNLNAVGLSLSGNVLSVIQSTSNIITTGNVTGNYFIGNGSQLTGIIVEAGAAITNGNSNVSVGANGNVTVGVTGTSNVAVFTPTGVEITSTVTATGNIIGGNLNAAGLSLSSNVVSALNVTANIAGGNITAGNVTANFYGNLVGSFESLSANITAGNVNVTSNVNAGNLNATGNVTANYYFGNGSTLSGMYGNVQTNAFMGTYTGNLIPYNVNGNVITNSISATSYNPNIGLTPGYHGIVTVNSNTAVLMPVGNTFNYPTTSIAGMMRWNTDLGYMEVYNGTQWTGVETGTGMGMIASDVFIGSRYSRN